MKKALLFFLALITGLEIAYSQANQENSKNRAFFGFAIKNMISNKKSNFDFATNASKDGLLSHLIYPSIEFNKKINRSYLIATSIGLTRANYRAPGFAVNQKVYSGIQHYWILPIEIKVLREFNEAMLGLTLSYFNTVGNRSFGAPTGKGGWVETNYNYRMGINLSTDLGMNIYNNLNLLIAPGLFFQPYNFDLFMIKSNAKIVFLTTTFTLNYQLKKSE
jgi:hypothetical protein